MMRKILSWGAAVFVLAGVVLFGQKAEKPRYPFEVDKNIATAVFAKKTYNEVWEATLKALIASDYKTTTLEKDAGIIKAVDIKKPVSVPVPNGEGVITRQGAYNAIAVRVEAQKDKVAVSLRWDRVAKFTLLPAGANGNSILSALYDKMAELLYGEVEKK